jgi:hypothetical protein
MIALVSNALWLWEYGLIDVLVPVLETRPLLEDVLVEPLLGIASPHMVEMVLKAIP